MFTYYIDPQYAIIWYIPMCFDCFERLISGKCHIDDDQHVVCRNADFV